MAPTPARFRRCWVTAISPRPKSTHTSPIAICVLHTINIIRVPTLLQQETKRQRTRVCASFENPLHHLLQRSRLQLTEPRSSRGLSRPFADRCFGHQPLFCSGMSPSALGTLAELFYEHKHQDAPLTNVLTFPTLPRSNSTIYFFSARAAFFLSRSWRYRTRTTARLHGRSQSHQARYGKLTNEQSRRCETGSSLTSVG